MHSTAVTVGEEVIQWLKATVLPKVCEKIGKSCENITLTIKCPENCFFLSLVYFVNVKFQSGETISLVIKKPPTSESMQLKTHASALFHNEIIFYEEFSNNNPKFPRCYYTIEDRHDMNKTVIITENITSMGFKICPEAYNIPLNYTISGIKEIARFHGLGYVMKTREPEKFSKIVNDLQEYRYFPGGWLEMTANTTSTRAIDYLRKKEYDPHFCNIMENHLKNAFSTVILDALKPLEPLAVICHGDFTRNNLFYRENETGHDTMLIDFAMLKYSSPAIDFATFLYLSCSVNDIFENFHVIFNAYHTTLLNYLQNEGITQLDQYSYENLLADYKRRALFGYVIATFFVPFQRGLLSFEDIDPCNIEDYASLNRNLGGDELSAEFADLLINLRNTGSLDHVISP